MINQRNEPERNEPERNEPERNEPVSIKLKRDHIQGDMVPFFVDNPGLISITCG